MSSRSAGDDDEDDAPRLLPNNVQQCNNMYVLKLYLLLSGINGCIASDSACWLDSERASGEMVIREMAKCTNDSRDESLKPFRLRLRLMPREYLLVSSRGFLDTAQNF